VPVQKAQLGEQLKAVATTASKAIYLIILLIIFVDFAKIG
jgi:hypothetical protein